MKQENTREQENTNMWETSVDGRCRKHKFQFHGG